MSQRMLGDLFMIIIIYFYNYSKPRHKRSCDFLSIFRQISVGYKSSVAKKAGEVLSKRFGL